MSAQSEPRRPHLPGETGVWVFILGDMLMFAAFFIVFMFYRGEDVALYVKSQHTLNQHLGALNTFFMLTSSWCVAVAVETARGARLRGAQGWLLAAMACALGFVIVKFFEYREKILAGFTLNSNDFFMYYYMLTGLHLMHVLLGMGVLAYLWSCLRAPAGDATLRTLESGASFWHMVDILWIVLFALLYLVR